MTRNSAWLSLPIAATLLFSSALPIPASAQTVSFIAHKDFTSGFHPVSVAVGDFNGDGIQDLAVANKDDNTVSVLLGNGDGTFQPAQTFSVGANPNSVAVGDFNHDGKLDLVVANKGSNNISVLMGNGDGTLQPAVNYPVGIAPVSVVVVDLTDQGTQDLAVANSGDNTVSVLYGSLGSGGGGTFRPGPTFFVGITPTFVTAVPDVACPYPTDLVVANSGSNTVSLLRGNGTRQDFPVGINPQSVAVGDFNGDGMQDLAVANYFDNTISVLLASATAPCGLTFQPATTYGVGLDPQSVAVGDFNGDGKMDLAAANYGSTTVSILLGNGDGTFQAKRDFAAGGDPWSVAVGDFNGDGKLDLAVANAGSITVSVLLGNGDGTFLVTPTYGVGFNPQSVAVGDFNGDGKLDLAVANAGSTTVSVLLGNGDGTFQTARTIDVGTAAPVSVAAGDFNGDGKPDLAVATYGSIDIDTNVTASNAIAVLLGNGDGTFQAPQTFGTGTGPFFVAVGDFNGDGASDLAVADFGTYVQRGNTISVLLGNGDGTFLAARSFGVDSGPTWVAVGDFNRDGKLDLASANQYSTTVSVLLGNGDGTFQTAQTLDVGCAPWGVAVGDFNADGKQDLAVANKLCSDVLVLLGNGDGTFQTTQTFGVDKVAFAVHVGDLNGDGKPDLAVANLGSTTVSVLVGNGDGTFQAAQNFGAGLGPGFVGVDDFNGDGKLDLAVANYYSAGTVSVLINNTATAPNTFTLTVNKAGTGSGTVTSTSSPDSPTQINCGSTCSTPYGSGTVVTLMATPAFGSVFTGWSGCDTVSGATCTVTMSAARSVTANFVVQRFTLTVSKASPLGIGNGTVTSSPPGINCGPTCSATYDSGTVVTLTATPAFGSMFKGWSGCDTASGTTCTVTMSAARSVTAHFLP